MTTLISVLAILLQQPASVPATGGGVRHPVLAWRVQTGGPVRSSPALAGNIGYVGGTDGRVYAIDLTSGATQWTTAVGAALASTPAVSRNRVFVSARGNLVIALDAQSGQEVWRTQTGTDVAAHAGGEHWDYFVSSPVLVGRTVIVGSGDGRLQALRAESGAAVWTFKADGRIRSSPRVKDGLVVFGTIRGSVYAVSAADGRERWRFETDGYRIDSAAAGFDRTSVLAPPAFAGDLVFIGSRDGRFYALSMADGRERWRTKFEPSWVVASAAISGSAVIVATSDAQCVAAFESTTGQERWRYNARTRVLSSPLVVGDQVQVGLESGAIVSIDAASRRGRGFTPDVSERIARHFMAAGYEALNAESRAKYLRERIADKRPSVVVFALDDLPDDVAGDPAASLLRQYLDGGGNAIWVGVIPPGYVRRNAEGQPVEIRNDGPRQISGVPFELGNGDAYGLRITPDGASRGLSAFWLARGETRRENVTTVLATDEFGRPAAWIKGFGGPPGTGFVRLWGSTSLLIDAHLRDMRTVAEHVLGASARWSSGVQTVRE